MCASSRGYENGTVNDLQYFRIGECVSCLNSTYTACLCVFVFLREENISHQWKDLLQQLKDQRGLLKNIVGTLSVLRDIELVSQELKELQVSLHLQSFTGTAHLVLLQYN